MDTKILLFAIIAYLVGSINPATLFTYFHLKRDIREFGDGNPGATNVFLHVNRLSGIIVFLLDVSKSFLMLWFAGRYGITGGQLAIIGTFVIVGHNFPIFHKFKGGTGISSFIGGLLFMSTTLAIQVFVFALTLILIMYIIKIKVHSNYSALEIGEAVGFLVILYFAHISQDYTFKSYVFLSTAVVVIRRFNKINYFAKKILAKLKTI
ncbi:MAG: glycerol-3-phosphate acyltransferase [Caldisericum sp.]